MLGIYWGEFILGNLQKVFAEEAAVQGTEQGGPVHGGLCVSGGFASRGRGN